MSQRFRRSRQRRLGLQYPTPTYHWSNIWSCDSRIREPNWWNSVPPSVLPFDEYGDATNISRYGAPKSWRIPFFSHSSTSSEERDEPAPTLQPVEANALTSPDCSLTQSGISKEKISAFVRDNLLKNHNIAYLPDYVEGALYENAVTALMALLEGVITTSKIEVLGHVINFSIHPIADSMPNETAQAPAI